MAGVETRRIIRRQVKHRKSESELMEKKSVTEDYKGKNVLEKISKLRNHFIKREDTELNKTKLNIFLTKGNILNKNIFRIKKSKSLDDLKLKQITQSEKMVNREGEKVEKETRVPEEGEEVVQKTVYVEQTKDEEKTNEVPQFVKPELKPTPSEQELKMLKLKLMQLNMNKCHQVTKPTENKKVFDNVKFKQYKRRSSLEKIREIPSYICTQSFIAFPNACLWLKEFLTVVSCESRKLIPTVKLLFLTLAIYLGIFLLFLELSACLFSIMTLSTPPGLVFLVCCILGIGGMTIRVVLIENKHGTSSVK